jgi:hypothetical protein
MKVEGHIQPINNYEHVTDDVQPQQVGISARSAVVPTIYRVQVFDDHEAV